MSKETRVSLFDRIFGWLVEETEPKMADMLAAKLEPGAVYLIAYDERRYPTATLRTVSDILWRHDIDATFLPGAREGDAGLKFIDPENKEV